MEEGRQRVFSGAPHEERYGYCRAVRVGDRITVAGTAPVWPDGSCDPDAGAQARRCCEIIATALAELGGGLDDVVRTRMFVTSAEDSEAVGDVHAEFFGRARPAATMVVVTALLDPRWKVEIEVDAVASRPASVEVMDPDDLSKNESYSQVAIGSGSRLIFVAGQVSETAEGEFVGEGDFAFQARQAFANVGRALVAAGVGVEAVARDHHLRRRSPARVPAADLRGTSRGLRRSQAHGRDPRRPAPRGAGSDDRGRRAADWAEVDRRPWENATGLAELPPPRRGRSIPVSAIRTPHPPHGRRSSPPSTKPSSSGSPRSGQTGVRTSPP